MMMSKKTSDGRKAAQISDYGTRNVVESAIESSKASHTAVWGKACTKNVRQWDHVQDSPNDEAENEYHNR